MLKLTNATVTALLAVSFSVAALAEKDGATATPSVAAAQPAASDGAPSPRKGYDGEECRTIYGETDCANFEHQMQNCENNFNPNECAELRQCIDELGYEACLVHLNY